MGHALSANGRKKRKTAKPRPNQPDKTPQKLKISNYVLLKPQPQPKTETKVENQNQS